MLHVSWKRNNDICGDFIVSILAGYSHYEDVPCVIAREHLKKRGDFMKDMNFDMLR